NFCLLFVLSNHFYLFGQNNTHTDYIRILPNGDTVVRCVSHQLHQELLRKTGQNDEQFEKWIRDIRQKPRNKNFIDNDEILRIPVVVHVIHEGEAIGTGRNISDAQIQSQLTVLNQDFRRTVNSRGFNNNPVGADTKIEFVLAKRNPSGGATTGINRILRTTIAGSPPLPPYSSTQVDTDIKPNTIWDPTRYMNMWVIDLASPILGYAQFPVSSGLLGVSGDCGAGVANTDGLVMRYQSFGSSDYVSMGGIPYDKGRTTTHEIGHYLGLRHIWGDANCGDDFCADTPTAQTANYGCPTNRFSCGSVDMVQNYMDYTDDACMNIFTVDQKARMRAVLYNSSRRATLINSEVLYAPLTLDAGIIGITEPFNQNCSTTIIPKIIIKNFGTSTLTSLTITYAISGGSNVITNWTGSLAPNATTTITLTSSTTTNGSKNIAININNPNGGVDELSINNALNKDFVVGNGLSIPAIETFEGGIFPPTNWRVINNGNDCISWRKQSVTSGSTAGVTDAAMMRCFAYTGSAQTDEFITPVYNLPASTNLQMNFDVAYARYDNTSNERLNVLISIDCGVTFSALSPTSYNKAGATLSTRANTTTEFQPAIIGEWRNETINITNYAGNNVQFKFISTNDYGNNIYIDNIEVKETGAEISFVNSIQSVTETTTLGTGCRKYIDYAIPLKISAAPTGGNAQVTITATSSDAYSPADYEITTVMPLVFNAGSSANQTFNLRVYDDASVENTETIIFNFTLNKNGSNATKSAKNQTLTLSLNDNDFDAIPFNSGSTIYSQNFDSPPTGFTISSLQGHDASTTNAWRIGTQQQAGTGNSLYVSSAVGSSTYQTNNATKLGARTPLIDASSGGNLTLSFNYKVGGEFTSPNYFDYGSIGYSLEGDLAGYPIRYIGDITPNLSTTLATPFYNVTTTTLFSQVLPDELKGKKFHIWFIWQSDGTAGGSQPSFVIDDISVVQAAAGANIANTLTSRQEYLGPNATVYFYNSSNELIARIQNTSAHDYGCTTVEIDRVGTAASQFWGATGDVSLYLANKTIKVTPTTNNPAGSYHVTMYLNNTEVTGWETTTTKNRSVMRLAKTSGAIASVTNSNANASHRLGIPHPTAPRGNFGTNYYIQSTFNNGFSGIGVGDPSSPAPLPVSLTTFTAQRQNENQVKLTWITTSETNNQGFDIEKSKDANNFEKIAFVDGLGNSIVGKTYTFVDNQKEGTYYRLKQKDFNGNFDYSAIRFVEGSDDNNLIIFPNPTLGTVSLKLPRKIDGNNTGKIRILDVNGKELKSFEGKINQAEIFLKTQVPQLQNGMYIIDINTNVGYWQQKLIKQ
ncbi:MAG: T9SS C-terminal target domain-containing protein, partial [Cytophagia bacterium]